MVGKLVVVILKKMVSEKILTLVLIKLGDFLVNKSSNKLEDAIWNEVKKALDHKE